MFLSLRRPFLGLSGGIIGLCEGSWGIHFEAFSGGNEAKKVILVIFKNG
jgi:hypothetical protein